MDVRLWETLLLAWLHDPFDKPADIPGHFQRALRYASLVFGSEISESDLASALGDQMASAYERLPMPDARGRYDELGVSPDSGHLTVVHPLSAEQRQIHAVLNERAVREVLAKLCPPEMEARRRFLTLWRLAPERLAEIDADFLLYPAETRCPDHTIWHHLDTTAAMAWATRGGKGAAALLSFKIGPVQPFIEAARSLRDLLSGSFIVSNLAFAAIRPVLDSCGPAALIYPALRGVPVMDYWLRQQGVPVSEPDKAALSRPSIPHRFLALVPAALMDELKAACRDSAKTRWKEIAAKVRAFLGSRLDKDWPDWDRLWDDQIDSYFDIRTTAFRITDADQKALLGKEAVTRFEPLKHLGRRGDVEPGSWQNAVEISAALMDAHAKIRHIPPYHPEPPVPGKCTLLGTYEQVGPARLADSRKFWEAVQGDSQIDVRKNTDRLCAVSFTRRLAYRSCFRSEFGLDWDDVVFDDTKSFAQRSGGSFKYYALLAMDGDHMGKWLAGEKSPPVREVLHPKIVSFHEKDAEAREALGIRRPVSPALHASISAALNHFATRVVPEAIEQADGMLIYAGGDDVLAALPLKTALECARKLRFAFSSFDVLGKSASCSAGLAIAHCHEDLRRVLGAARRAEKQSKDSGRNRLTIAALRRSGEHSYAGCGWEYAETLERQAASFANGSSDRWSYVLRRQLPVLEGLPPAAFQAELKRLLARSEKRDPRFVEDFALYWELEKDRPPRDVMTGFLTLAQTASFLTRGRD